MWCGGTTIKVAEYKLDVSSVGFVHQGAKLFTSLTRIIKEERKTKVFKESMYKWVKEHVSIRPNI